MLYRYDVVIARDRVKKSFILEYMAENGLPGQ